jgi:hypothetical protein
MKIAQICALAGALILSSVALAEGGGDRTFEKMMVAKIWQWRNTLLKKEKSSPWCQVMLKMRQVKCSSTVYKKPLPVSGCGFFWTALLHIRNLAPRHRNVRIDILVTVNI